MAGRGRPVRFGNVLRRSKTNHTSNPLPPTPASSSLKTKNRKDNVTRVGAAGGSASGGTIYSRVDGVEGKNGKKKSNDSAVQFLAKNIINTVHFLKAESRPLPLPSGIASLTWKTTITPHLSRRKKEGPNILWNLKTKLRKTK